MASRQVDKPNRKREAAAVQPPRIRGSRWPVPVCAKKESRVKHRLRCPHIHQFNVRRDTASQYLITSHAMPHRNYVALDLRR